MMSGADYPVNMKEYTDESCDGVLIDMVSELLTRPQIGKKCVHNIGCAFDTEASSFTDSEGDKVGLCYVWMFGIGEVVTYGRTLGGFVSLVTRLDAWLKSNKSKIYVYVHNLKYDFSFIKKQFRWSDVFIHGNREPLYARTNNIEFRDSLVLSGNQSLARIGEKVLRRPVHKAVGDLNYDLIRTPETPLTQQELHYCEMDIRVLIEYIEEKIEDDGDITKIPYTNTGYVRNFVRNKCFERRGRYMDFIDGLTLTPDTYLQCEKAFAGGAVGPNIKYATKVIENLHSYDIKSSYPYVMVAKYFPMGFFEPVSNKAANENLEALVTSQCCLFRLEIFNLVPKQDYCFPISYSKCNEVIGCREASGRIISAAYVNINVTELDYENIKRFYDLEQAEEIRVSYMRIAPRGYLPEPIIRSVLKFFYDKTTLDGVEGKSVEYMIAKNMLNAVYGMMVERVVREPYGFDEEFTKGSKDYVKQVVSYNENRNRFLYYPWGVWVTAHARFRLYDAIYNIGDDWRYCDTDCVKFVGEHQDYFDKVNAEARQSLADLALRLGMHMEKVVPETGENAKEPHKKMYLGVWEHEYDAKRFKTLGAKRYLVEHNDGRYAITVAGPNKKRTLEYLLVTSEKEGVSPFKLFTEKLVIPPEYANRLSMTYIDKPRYGYITDYTGVRRWYSCDSGVHAIKEGYSFSITDQMKEAMEWLMCDAHYQETYA